MPLPTPAGYRPLAESTVPEFLAGLPDVSRRLGGKPTDWKVSEVGDGNLNLVFIATGPEGGVCVKQALPYVRLIGESWPMPLKRAFFEQRYMREHAPRIGRLAPALHHYDERLYAMVMELLRPHVIMRRGMIQGTRYPRFAGHIAEYLARSLFFTSDLALPAGKKRRKVAVFCANTELCKITEELIFTDPYMVHERNRWTTPQLDGIAAEFRGDAALKLAVSRLKLKFLCSAEALVHGDLHTGSIMVTPEDTRVIDPEFAFFGPMGFDIGAVLGNLLLSYYSQDGHARAGDPREEYQDWILETVERVWLGFREKFLTLWQSEAAGDAYPSMLFGDGEGVAALGIEHETYLGQLFADSLGFAAAKMIRRILGLAHNIDFEWIKDPDRRALCETRSLRLARELMVRTSSFTSIGNVTAAARTLRREIPALAG